MKRPMGPRLRCCAVGGAVAYGLLGVVSLLPAALSVMAFDAPGSEDNPLTIALVAGLLASPVVLLASAALLVLGWALDRRRLALFALWLPAALPAYLALVSLALDQFCGGTFTCR